MTDSPGGATAASPDFCRPSGARMPDWSRSQGLRPWLLTAAASRLGPRSVSSSQGEKGISPISSVASLAGEWTYPLAPFLFPFLLRGPSTWGSTDSLLPPLAPVYFSAAGRSQAAEQEGTEETEKTRARLGALTAALPPLAGLEIRPGHPLVSGGRSLSARRSRAAPLFDKSGQGPGKDLGRNGRIRHTPCAAGRRHTECAGYAGLWAGLEVWRPGNRLHGTPQWRGLLWKIAKTATKKAERRPVLPAKKALFSRANSIQKTATKNAQGPSPGCQGLDPV